jgi:hypothetical protein
MIAIFLARPKENWRESKRSFDGTYWRRWMGQKAKQLEQPGWSCKLQTRSISSDLNLSLNGSRKNGWLFFFALLPSRITHTVVSKKENRHKGRRGKRKKTNDQNPADANPCLVNIVAGLLRFFDFLSWRELISASLEFSVGGKEGSHPPGVHFLFLFLVQPPKKKKLTNKNEQPKKNKKKTSKTKRKVRI